MLLLGAAPSSTWELMHIVATISDASHPFEVPMREDALKGPSSRRQLDDSAYAFRWAAHAHRAPRGYQVRGNCAGAAWDSDPKPPHRQSLGAASCYLHPRGQVVGDSPAQRCQEEHLLAPIEAVLNSGHDIEPVFTRSIPGA